MNPMYFNKKSKRGPVVETRKTIERANKENLEYFKRLQTVTLPKKRKELEKIKSKNGTDCEAYKLLLNEIFRIESKEEEIDYFYKTTDILKRYYELKINEAEAETEHKGEKEKKIEETSTSETTDGNTSSEVGILKFLESETKTEKINICKEYMITVYPEEYQKLEYIDIYTCPQCKTELIREPSKGEHVCPDCYLSYRCMDDMTLSYAESQEMTYNKKFSYERINHFKEWLQRFQAKENTAIPEEIIEKIKLEIKKERVRDLKKITKTKIRKWLKKIGENKYYEHEDNIINRINGVKPLQMNSDQEERLCLMFKQIEEPFEKYKPESRKNFLSFPYTIYKFCELLEWDEYLPCFRLLKSDEKLYEQDQIWKKICNSPEIAWEYWPTSNGT